MPMFPEPIKSFGGLKVMLQVSSNDSSKQHPLLIPNGKGTVTFPHFVWRQCGFAMAVREAPTKLLSDNNARMKTRRMFLFSCISLIRYVLCAIWLIC